MVHLTILPSDFTTTTSTTITTPETATTITTTLPPTTIYTPTRPPIYYPQPITRKRLAAHTASIPHVVRRHLARHANLLYVPLYVVPSPAVLLATLFGPGTLYDALLHEGLAAPMEVLMARSRAMRRMRKGERVARGYDDQGAIRLNAAIRKQVVTRNWYRGAEAGEVRCMRCVVSGGVCSISRTVQKTVGRRVRCGGCERNGRVCVRVTRDFNVIIRLGLKKAAVRFGASARRGGSEWWAWVDEREDGVTGGDEGVRAEVERYLEEGRVKTGGFGGGVWEFGNETGWLGGRALPDWRGHWPEERGNEEDGLWWKRHLKRQGREELVQLLVRGKKQSLKQILEVERRHGPGRFAFAR